MPPKPTFMGLIYAEIELINAEDVTLARKHIIGEDEIKRIHVPMLVDSGVYNLCINEEIQEQLGLPFIEKRKAQLANGHIEEYNVVGPVVVKFKNRNTICNAMILQGSNEPLLGAIPLEDMDVLIHPYKARINCKPGASLFCTNEIEVKI